MHLPAAEIGHAANEAISNIVRSISGRRQTATDQSASPRPRFGLLRIGDPYLRSIK